MCDVGVLRTRRQEQEQALREAEERFRQEVQAARQDWAAERRKMDKALQVRPGLLDIRPSA